MTLHFIIQITETLIFLLIFLAGLSIYKNYSLFMTELNKAKTDVNTIMVTDTSDLFQKNPDAILNDYIGDFF